MNLTKDPSRATALQELWWVLLFAASDDADERRVLLAWLDERSADEGGFLWLVSALGSRPDVIDDVLRRVATGTARKRRAVRAQLAAVL